MKNKPKYLVSSKEELTYLENAYKEFIKKYELEFKGAGELLVKRNSKGESIEIILKEIAGENNLIVKDKNLENKIVSKIVPYQMGYNLLRIKDKEYWLEHQALHERITERYDPPRFFSRSDSGIKSGYTR